MAVSSPKILQKLTVLASVAIALVALPIQAAQAAKVIWTVYEISVKHPGDPGAPPPDYPGVGSR